MGKLSLFVGDVETTGLGSECDIIEISFLRIDTGDQKTWWLKAINEAAIEPAALEINGHKLEDITWKTKEGREKYRLPEVVLPEIENWLYDDGVTKLDRAIVGQNVKFDSLALSTLWSRYNASETYPFGYGEIDTKMLAIFFDYIQGANSRRYNLGQIVKRLGITKRKAHSASEDVLMTADVFSFMANFFIKAIDKSDIPLPLMGKEIEEEAVVEEEEEEPDTSEEDAINYFEDD